MATTETTETTGHEEGGAFPLVVCHDVSWPHARRDSYYAPELIPEQDRQPTVEGSYVFPGDPGLKELDQRHARRRHPHHRRHPPPRVLGR